ncbi:TetR/AcrR family transcriptional regulator [Streptomyces sp. NRRL F-5126]|uniref:TetR/AcrR family transcriptional regulator n=1 Tax=Streptomyces sp. NRRL F-5126 TaxID=1463857 RepID=UPI0004CBBEC9|nr:TetR/AcrR family transcriptional regulator [Streptomyces sp. NRRL F-5126]
MARWQPNAPERLVVAALDLFAERGYDSTTVIDIAQRAGLTKSTFFRHFPDKREVLFAGGGSMADVLAQGIAGAPGDAAPLEAVAQGLDAVGREIFVPARRAFASKRRTVIAANPELREREALKGIGLTAAMAAALRSRGVPDVASRVAAQLGALVMAIAHERWTGTDAGEGLGEEFGGVARRALAEVREAGALSLG